MPRSKESRTTSKDNHSNHSTPEHGAHENRPGKPDQHFLISSVDRTSTASAGNHSNGGGTITVTGDLRNHSAFVNGQLSPDIVEKIKELVRLSHEQGHLTYNDINEA